MKTSINVQPSEFDHWYKKYGGSRINRGSKLGWVTLEHNIVTQGNFDHLVDLKTSIHFQPSEFDQWYNIYGGGRIKRGLKLGWVTVEQFRRERG